MHGFHIRLILALAVCVTVVSVGFAYVDVLAHRHVLRQELGKRARWMGMSIAPEMESAVRSGDLPAIRRTTQAAKNRTGALGLAIYDASGKLLAGVGPEEVIDGLGSGPILRTLEKGIETSQFGKQGRWKWLERTFPLRDGSRMVGSMALLVDASYIHADVNAVWGRSFVLLAVCVVLIAVITAGMVSWFLIRPVSRTAERLRRLRTGHEKALEPNLDPKVSDPALLSPITREVETIARSLQAARAAASAEARLREAGEQLWTAEKLAAHIRSREGSGRIFVVSNREPYMHVRRGREIECVVPPSGLVTALEPVLRACDGVWVACGSGDADAEKVDAFDRLRVPPDDPKYTLRRVWMSEEEEAHYYDGFANEGLWPLCHIAHTRPVFRSADWECYQRINERFAQALVAEMEDCPDPVVFVQDYHFALLPRMVKQARPDARVAIFWHIPWPNPEAFGICPWQAELLDGMLGADLIGFHIPAHCHNFLLTVDRVLESRTSYEHLTTRRQGHVTTVRPYPVSVSGESVLHKTGAEQEPQEEERSLARAQLLAPFGVRAESIALGVDRLDYTKGILERMAAFEQLLEEWPRYRERIAFVQIAAPSRARIPAYADLRQRVREMTARINTRFQTAHWKPVTLIERQCSHEEVSRWYSAADLCMVTSLHDGMNLVAKEYVAARGDEDGVLILSKFTGAAMELEDALLVNPYDTAGVAEAMRRGLEMNRDERRERMRRMRRQVLEHNIYLWAASVLGDLRELRIEGDDDLAIARMAPASLAAPDIARKRYA